MADPSGGLESNDIAVIEVDKLALDGEEKLCELSGITGWYDKLELNESLYEDKDDSTDEIKLSALELIWNDDPQGVKIWTGTDNEDDIEAIEQLNAPV